MSNNQPLCCRDARQTSTVIGVHVCDFIVSSKTICIEPDVIIWRSSFCTFTVLHRKYTTMDSSMVIASTTVLWANTDASGIVIPAGTLSTNAVSNSCLNWSSMNPRLYSETGVFSWCIKSLTSGDVSLSWLMMLPAVVITATTFCSIASSSCGSVTTWMGSAVVAKRASAHVTNVFKIIQKSYTSGCMEDRGTNLFRPIIKKSYIQYIKSCTWLYSRQIGNTSSSRENRLREEYPCLTYSMSTNKNFVNRCNVFNRTPYLRQQTRTLRPIFDNIWLK